MRVISGSARGTKLKTVEGLKTRPTTDRIKESMFNLIQNTIYDRQVLDLFSGSGSLGIEALSRGAEEAVFVEKNRKCKAIIEENLQKTHLFEQAAIMTVDVRDAIGNLAAKGQKFGLVFMDPPYNMGFIKPVMALLSERNLLDKEGIIVVEHEKNDILEDEIYGFRRIKCKQYGITTISIYKEETPCE